MGQSVDREQLDAARALDAACEQIQLALQESQPSVDALASALRSLATMLTAPAGTQREETLEAMRSEMLRAVTCLQYHDRMTQHLTHVRDHLADSAGQLAAQEGPSGEQWTGLHRRLQSEAGRMYPSRSTTSDNAPAGDIDLF